MMTGNSREADGNLTSIAMEFRVLAKDQIFKHQKNEYRKQKIDHIIINR